MSFFRRLANVVKGTVSTLGKDDPVESAARHAALDHDLANPTPSAAARERLAAMKRGEATPDLPSAEDRDRDAALRDLAARYDKGELSRHEYDRERAKLIHGDEGPPERTL